MNMKRETWLGVSLSVEIRRVISAGGRVSQMGDVQSSRGSDQDPKVEIMGCLSELSRLEAQSRDV